MLRLALCLGVAASYAAPASDMVTSLPGWDQPLPSAMFSGFLDAGASSAKQLHYVYVEAEAPLDPATAPVILWLNGGPGCSSLEGFFYEHGPLVVGDAHAPPNINFGGDASPNTNTSQLVRNMWSWSRVANILYLEAPAGVGFSYSSDPADYNTGDNQTATDNLAALQSFFKKFPHLQSNDFYVSGESYGGVYVPTLSLKIYEAGSSFLGTMKGYLVGNGVFDFEDAAPTQVPFAYGHGFISTKLHKQILNTCEPSYLKPSKACQALLDKIEQMKVDVNPYDAFRTCYQPPSRSLPSMMQLLNDVHSHPDGKQAVYEWMRERHQATAGHRAGPLAHSVGEAVPCINSQRGTEYLNTPAVKTALHVDVSPNTWQVCGGVNYTDDGVFPSMIAVHKQMQQYKPRVLIYNGDVDPGCNYLWAEASAERFDLAVESEWGPWVYTDALVGEQLGGFVTGYANDVSVATVHGAGHMSPQWRPEAVYNMLDRWINGKSL